MKPPAPVTSTFLPPHMTQHAPVCVACVAREDCCRSRKRSICWDGGNCIPRADTGAAGDIAVAAADASPAGVKDCRNIASLLGLCIVAAPLQRRIFGDEGMVVKPRQFP